MDYRQLAEDILNNVGGKENIKKVNKDYTNLRFVLKNNKKADKTAIEKLEGVKSVQITDTHFVVMIGAKVPEVFKELIGITGEFKEEEEVITKGAIISAKLKNIFKIMAVPFVVLTVLYIVSVSVKGIIPENIYSILNIVIMGLWAIFVGYIAQRCGTVFRTNTVITLISVGFFVGVNGYYLNIIAAVLSLVSIILLNMLIFILTKAKK